MVSKSLATVFIIVICVLCFPILIGLIGGAFGIVVGVFGAVFGVIFGIIGGVIGGIFGFFGWLFDGIFNWHHGFDFFDFDICTALILVILVVWLARNKSQINTGQKDPKK
jgi:hypothetical protein